VKNNPPTNFAGVARSTAISAFSRGTSLEGGGYEKFRFIDKRQRDGGSSMHRCPSTPKSFTEPLFHDTLLLLFQGMNFAVVAPGLACGWSVYNYLFKVYDERIPPPFIIFYVAITALLPACKIDTIII
jgi:hypothetical protein